MQAKLHRWAAADPGRRFDDLFNFVHDPSTLTVAFSRVAGNRGANTPGVDGLRAADVEEAMGVPGFLDASCGVPVQVSSRSPSRFQHELPEHAVRIHHMLEATWRAWGDVTTWAGSIGAVAASGVAAGVYVQSQFDRRRS
jgi:hypothetical protein